MPDLYADENISWDADQGLVGFEAWEPDDDYEPEPAGRCAYCGTTEVRENPDPYGGEPCCEACFSILIGDEDSATRCRWCGCRLDTCRPLRADQRKCCPDCEHEVPDGE